MKYTNQLLVNDEMCERNNDHSGTFPRATTAQNRGYVLPVFSYYRIIDNTNSNLICQKFNQCDMTTDIAESQDNSEKIDLKSVIGTENPYDAFEY